jgi:3-deoxy-D-manno-octulosonic-acid transferase
MRILYNIVIFTYTSIIYIASLFSHKAFLWVEGRRNWYNKLVEAIQPGSKVVWVHCASLGEFEQGRPVIEKIKSEEPEVKILLTFFSPSGYEIRKTYSLADYICYLPADSPRNARRFVEKMKPAYVIFIKYEFWYNYISNLCRNKIPVYLVSGIFRKKQLFFRWYGAFFRKLLKMFTHIFVQNTESFELLKGIGLSSVTLAGDTRFDRVRQIAAVAKDLPLIERFRGNEKLFLAGSSWRADEEIIAQYINSDPNRMKWIFAPHEIDNANIERLEKLFRIKTIRYSGLDWDSGDSRILIIDNIGMLSSVYRYSFIAAIGGGFGKGIHNILEAASWSIPVVFGPNYHKFREATELINDGGAKIFSNYSEFENIINKWISDDNQYKNDASSAGKYVINNTGATEIIIEKIRQKNINKLSQLAF